MLKHQKITISKEVLHRRVAGASRLPYHALENLILFQCLRSKPVLVMSTLLGIDDGPVSRLNIYRIS